MKKQSLAFAMVMAIGAGTPDIGLARATGAALAQDKSIGELLKQLEERFDVRFSYESGLKNIKVKDDADLDAPQKGDLARFVEDAALDRVCSHLPRLLAGDVAYVTAQLHSGNG